MSPCEKCDQVAECSKTCAEWRWWFAAEWRKVRKLFGYEEES